MDSKYNDEVQKFVINMEEFYKKTLNDNMRDMKLLSKNIAKLCGVLAAKEILSIDEIQYILKFEEKDVNDKTNYFGDEK